MIAMTACEPQQRDRRIVLTPQDVRDFHVDP
jgi:hypothetical protein